MAELLNSGASLLHATLTTAKFEMRRAISARRLALALVMILFPPSMLYVVGYVSGGRNPEFVMAGTLGIVVWLSLLLWSTTNVSSELEGKGWLYLTSRRRGRFALLFGKLATSVVWGLVISQLSLLLCLLVCFVLVPLREPLKIWLCFTVLLALACISYACILSMIGTLFQKRAMMIGVGYLLIGEVLLATVPAIISKITIQFHLRGLYFNWLGWAVPFRSRSGDARDLQSYYINWGEHSSWFHVILVLTLAAICLGVAAYIIRNREYVTSDES